MYILREAFKTKIKCGADDSITEHPIVTRCMLLSLWLSHYILFDSFLIPYLIAPLTPCQHFVWLFPDTLSLRLPHFLTTLFSLTPSLPDNILFDSFMIPYLFAPLTPCQHPVWLFHDTLSLCPPHSLSTSCLTLSWYPISFTPSLPVNILFDSFLIPYIFDSLTPWQLNSLWLPYCMTTSYLTLCWYPISFTPSLPTK